MSNITLCSYAKDLFARCYCTAPPHLSASPLASPAQSMCCGLALDEQSYYEKPNPSLGDRGVTGFKKDTKRPASYIPELTNTVFEVAKRRALKHRTPRDNERLQSS